MSKKVSISEIKKVIKINKENTVKVFFKPNGSKEGFEAEFKNSLSLTDELLLENLAINSCFINGEYKPEYQHIGLVNAILGVMSNITLPKTDGDGVNLSVLHEWDNCFMFMETLYENKELCNYIHYLEDVVDSKIEYLKNKSKLDELFETLTEIVNKYDTQLDGIDMKKSLETLSGIGKLDEKIFIDALVGEVKKEKDKSKDNITKIEDVKEVKEKK